jgi:hypothetical protein
MTIADIIRRGRGTTHGWRVEPSGPTGRVALIHFTTPMLAWNPADPADHPNILSIGWGSVSDQNGLNTAFKVLGLPYRMDRDVRGGGPRITELAQGLKVSPPATDRASERKSHHDRRSDV